MDKYVQATYTGAEASDFIGPKELKDWVVEEYDLCNTLIKMLLTEKMEQAKGNTFAQITHDGATLDNRQHYQAVGIQFISPSWDRNYVVCTAFKRSLYNTGEDVAELISKTMRERTGFGVLDIANSCISDRAAMSVAKHFGFTHDRIETYKKGQDTIDISACLMHDLDKIPESAFGQLTRSQGKNVVNRFKDGEAVMKVCKAAARELNLDQNFDQLSKSAKVVDIPIVRPQIDKNGTRIAALCNTMHSLLRMAPAIEVCSTGKAGKDLLGTFNGESGEFKMLEAVKECEAIGYVCRIGTTIAQTESRMMSAIGPLLVSHVMLKLRAKKISMFNTQKISHNDKEPRESVEVSKFSPFGKVALERACLEGERRFCGNKTEVLTGGNPVVSRRELIASVLDLRTLKGGHMDGHLESKDILQEEYIKFAIKAIEWDKSKQKVGVIHITDGALGSKRKADKLLTAERQAKRLETDSLESGRVYGRDPWAAQSQPESEPVIDVEAALKELNDRLTKQFNDCFERWRKIDLEPFVIAQKPHLGTAEGKPLKPLEVIRDMLDLDMGIIYRTLISGDQDRSNFGWLPLMASCSVGQIGALLAESFCERAISQANLILTDRNTRLNDAELEMLVVLRMNREIMEHLKQKYKDKVAKFREKSASRPVVSDSSSDEDELEPVVVSDDETCDSVSPTQSPQR